MKTLLTMLALLLSFAHLAHADEKTPSENLNSLVATALADNPELKSSQARWQMFVARAKQAGSLDDPMLMLKIQNGLISAPFDFQKDSMTQKVIGLSQQLPFWGKRALREEVAAHDAETYRWQVEERKLELARMVKETWYQIWFTDKSLEIVARNIRILEDFTTIAETRYAVGQGAQQDVFKSRVESSKMLDMKISLEQERKSLEATMNGLLARPAGTPVGNIPDFEIGPTTGLSAGDLREKALATRPMVKSLQALIAKGKAGHGLAAKEYYPDVNLSLEYMQREPAMGGDGADMYSVGLTFNLPIQRERRHAMAAESDAETRMATEELNGFRNSLDAGIADLLVKMDRREKLATLYRTGIIPQAEQSLESATIGYRVGKVDFLTLLDSRMTLFTYERELYASKAEYMSALARLEATVGAEVMHNAP